MIETVFYTMKSINDLAEIKELESEVKKYNDKDDGYEYFLNMAGDRTFICFRKPKCGFVNRIKKAF